MISPGLIQQRMDMFRKRCKQLGLACTHQRLIIYRALASSASHPTPEAIYDQVRHEIPSISLATVYKNIKTFTEAGLLREVSVLHDSLRLDANLGNHHHLVCTRCKAVIDIPEEKLDPIRLRGKLPDGFVADRFLVEILGLCAACAKGRTN
ncbi:MAG: transcriptional repressor [Bryobacteraceae bacterium]|nr:transcriptional repressor [Bryobacteraceae bacterium]MDW8379352.1 transcriptional repressor [Bryobacterales bacterium]